MLCAGQDNYVSPCQVHSDPVAYLSFFSQFLLNLSIKKSEVALNGDTTIYSYQNNLSSAIEAILLIYSNYSFIINHTN